MTESIQSGGSPLPNVPQQIKKDTPTPLKGQVKAQFEQLETDVNEVLTSINKNILPTTLFLKVCDEWMSLDKKLAESLESGGQRTRIDSIVIGRLGFLMDTSKGTLDDTNKKYIFAYLYTDHIGSGSDSQGSEMITDSVGAEQLPNISKKLRDKLTTEGWKKEKINEAIKFAATIYPIVVLSTYMHKDTPIPSKENIDSTIKSDFAQFKRDCKKHFGLELTKQQESTFCSSLSEIFNLRIAQKPDSQKMRDTDRF